MPVTNRHSIKLQKPEGYDDWSRTKGGFLFGKAVRVPATVGIVWGHPKGASKPHWVPQELRFPVDKYSIAEVKAWAKKNLKSWIVIEAGFKCALAATVIGARDLLAFGGELKMMATTEAFVSLRTELEKAVSYKFGKEAFVHDFSNKEVVIGFSKSDIRPISSWESGEYDKTNFALKKDKIVFSGVVTKVTKSVSYEGFDTATWAELWDMEEALSTQQIRIKTICRACED